MCENNIDMEKSIPYTYKGEQGIVKSWYELMCKTCNAFEDFRWVVGNYVVEGGDDSFYDIYVDGQFQVEIDNDDELFEFLDANYKGDIITCEEVPDTE